MADSIAEAKQANLQGKMLQVFIGSYLSIMVAFV